MKMSPKPHSLYLVYAKITLYTARNFCAGSGCGSCPTSRYVGNQGHTEELAQGGGYHSGWPRSVDRRAPGCKRHIFRTATLDVNIILRNLSQNAVTYLLGRRINSLVDIATNYWSAEQQVCGGRGVHQGSQVETACGRELRMLRSRLRDSEEGVREISLLNRDSARSTWSTWGKRGCAALVTQVAGDEGCYGLNAFLCFL